MISALNRMRKLNLSEGLKCNFPINTVSSAGKGVMGKTPSVGLKLYFNFLQTPEVKNNRLHSLRRET